MSVGLPVGAQTLPQGFQESIVFSGLSEPTAVAFSSDGRVFVAEKSGVIKVFANLSATTPTVFADLRTKVHNFWDRGLLGLALAPSFPTQPYVYVLYTHNAAIGGTAPRWPSQDCPTPPGSTEDGCVVSGRLSRLQAAGNVMTGSEQVLIENWCQQYPSHSIGSLAFGDDGALYVSGGEGASFGFADYGQDGNPLNPCGDPPVGVGGVQTPPTAEGGALRSQSLQRLTGPAVLNGAILRVNPDTGAGMPDNPLASSSDANARRIIAYGLRNPFRITSRPGTNQIWVGDVGWGDWEEINAFTPSTTAIPNFGWPCYEGNGAHPSFDGIGLDICESLYTTPAAVTPPFFAYNHALQIVPNEPCPAGSSSITGLAFYTGGTYPAAYNGALFFADYSRDCIWVMFNPAPNPVPPAPAPTIATFVGNAAGPVDLKIGPGGDLYYVDLIGGKIRRLQYTAAGNQAPAAVATATPTSGSAPLTVQFDGTASSDPDPGDTIVSYAWDLDGDGQFNDSTSSQPQYTYTTGGPHTVRLRVTDNHGATGVSAPVVIRVGTPPTVFIDSPAASVTWKVSDVITFSGHATDATGAAIPGSGLSWSVILHHCPSNCHTHPVQSFAGVAGGSFAAPDHEYLSYLELTLTATDSSGLQTTQTVLLYPQTVTLTFQSIPSALQLVVGSSSQTTSFERTVIIGSNNSVSAPTPQVVGSSIYTWASWSDGGAQSHNIIAGSAAATYTATYTASAQPAGLVAAYAFNETSGTTSLDGSGNGHTGTLTNGATFAVGKNGNAVTLDGVNDFVNLANPNPLQLTGSMTLSAWINAQTFPFDDAAIVSGRTSGPTGFQLDTTIDRGPRTIGFKLTNASGSNMFRYGATPLLLNTWYHVAGVYNAATQTLDVYLNGQLNNGVLVGTITATQQNPTGAVHIGQRPGMPGPFNFAGKIDDVRLYGRALTPAEIQVDMNTPVGGTPPPNAPPTITAIANQTTNEDTATGAIAFTVGDAETAAGSLTVSGTSSNLTLVPTANIGLGGSGAARTVTVTPAANQSGPATITLTVSDGQASTSTSFLLTVAAVNDAPTITALANQTTTVGTAVGPLAFTVGDVETAAGSLTVTGSSSNLTLVPLSNIVFGGAGANRTVTVTPAAGQTGTATITMTVSDSQVTASTSFQLTVTATPAGLVAAYAFNEISGTTSLDGSGNGHTGTLTNGATFAVGKNGNAVTLDGVNDFVNLANPSPLQLTGSMTLSAWINAQTFPFDDAAIVSRRTSGPAGFQLDTTIDRGPRTIGFKLTNASGSNMFRYGATPLVLNTWYHVAGVYNAATQTLDVYLNGQLNNGVLVGTITATQQNPTGAVHIGQRPGMPGPFNFAGKIDDVRLYNRALTAAEIQSDMTTPVGGP